jgi:hypothetical protein
MVEITYQMVLSTLQTLALIVGIAYYLIIMRNSQRAQQMTLLIRQSEILKQILDKTTSIEGSKYNTICSQAEWSDYDEWFERYSSDEDYRMAFNYWMNCFEHTGVYLKEDIFDIRLLALRSASGFIWYWERHRDVIYERRKRLNRRRYCDMWEYAYDQLMEYLEEHPELAP